MKHELIAYDNLKPNVWNPNQMNDRQYQAEIESICAFGFIDPVTVREFAGDNVNREIVDGEHRWKAFGEIRDQWLKGQVSIAPEAQAQLIPLLDANLLPTVNLGALPDMAAKKLTVVLNETRGRANTVDLAALLAEIAAQTTPEDLRTGLPYSDAEIADLLKLTEFDWNNLPQSTGSAGGGEADSQESFVTLTLMMPESAHAVWLLAMDKVKAKLLSDGQALHADAKIAGGQVAELLAAEYIAGP